MLGFVGCCTVRCCKDAVLYDVADSRVEVCTGLYERMMLRLIMH